MSQKTSIPIDSGIKNELESLKREQMTYDEVLREMLHQFDPNETDVVPESITRTPPIGDNWSSLLFEISDEPVAVSREDMVDQLIESPIGPYSEDVADTLIGEAIDRGYLGTSDGGETLYGKNPELNEKDVSSGTTVVKI